MATRTALLDAALDCLVERGYAATTTIETARRAGVSRGAQLHHFPTKAELLAAAVDHLLERRLAEYRKAFADAPQGAVRLDAAIDLLWSMFEGPTFVAWLELWVAARTDVELATALLETDRRFVDASRELFVEMFPTDPGADSGFFDLGRDFAFALMDGMALQRLVPHADTRPPGDYLALIKMLAHQFAPTTEETP